MIAAENRDFGRHPRELFWPVEGGVEIHSVFIHPLFTTAAGLARYRRKHFANIDYGMIPRLFTHPGPIKLMDPSLAYVNNFTAAHRRYETTGRSFTYEDFLRCHDWTYPVQKACFTQAQHLPCRLVRLRDLQRQRRRAGRSGHQCSVRRHPGRRRQRGARAAPTASRRQGLTR